MDEPVGSGIIPVEDWLMAASLGDAAIVLEGLRRGIDVNARGRKAIRNTALTGAVREGRLDVIRILLAYGADMTLVDPYGFTPVTHAVIRSRPWTLLNPDREPDSAPLELLVAAGAQYRLCEAVLLNDVETT